jgi:hypothetical protein
VRQFKSADIDRDGVLSEEQFKALMLHIGQMQVNNLDDDA